MLDQDRGMFTKKPFLKSEVVYLRLRTCRLTSQERWSWLSFHALLDRLPYLCLDHNKPVHPETWFPRDSSSFSQTFCLLVSVSFYELSISTSSSMYSPPHFSQSSFLSQIPSFSRPPFAVPSTVTFITITMPPPPALPFHLRLSPPAYPLCESTRLSYACILIFTLSPYLQGHLSNLT